MSKNVRKMQYQTSLTTMYSHLWNSSRPTSENLSRTGNSSDIAALYTLSHVIYEDRNCESSGSICCYGFTEQQFTNILPVTVTCRPDFAISLTDYAPIEEKFFSYGLSHKIPFIRAISQFELNALEWYKKKRKMIRQKLTMFISKSNLAI